MEVLPNQAKAHSPEPETIGPRQAPALVRYLGSLNGARQVLWCYLLWYLLVVFLYFDPRPRLWITSVGLAGIIGFALFLSTAGTSRKTELDRWQIFRLFLMPFCVSSFAALIKEHGFILVFSPRPLELAQGAGLMLGFLALVRLARWWSGVNRLRT